MISTLRRTSRRFLQNAPVPCMHSAYYDLMDYLQLPSMMLQELPPWLNLCMLLRLGGALPGLSTGHASTVSSVEHAEWGIYLVRPQKLQSWLVTLKMACWLPYVASCSAHVLRPIFPPLIARRPGLRPRPHDFTLPDKDDKNFISRVLYRSLLH